MSISLNSELLEACILSILSEEPAYGYALTMRMREAVQLSESTLYPVLRRLLQTGCLETFDEQHQGRNRRFYRITETGRKALSSYREEWLSFRNLVNSIMKTEEAR